MTTRDYPMHVPSRYRLDIVSDSGLVVLRHLDGRAVVRFTVWDATWEEILRATEEDEGRIDEG